MDKSKANPSIRCSVSQCEYHCDHKEYCSLDKISVGTHETDPQMEQCTDCESFQVRK